METNSDGNSHLSQRGLPHDHIRLQHWLGAVQTGSSTGVATAMPVVSWAMGSGHQHWWSVILATRILLVFLAGRNAGDT